MWDYYRQHVAEWASRNGVELPHIPEHCAQAYHMFYLLLPDLEARQAFIERLKAHGVNAVFHYLPLHLSEVGRRLGGREGDCPVTESVSDRLVRLPFYNELTEADQARVIAALP